MTAVVPLAAATPELRFIGEAVLPTGTRFAGTEVGGLSGVDYDVRSGTYLAISDDAARRGPARLYRLEIDLGDGRLDDGDVRIGSIDELRGPGQASFAPGSVDPEAIRLHPDGGRLYWVSEGNADAGIAPAVVEARPDGAWLRDLGLPDYYWPAAGQGVRHNKAFESLTLWNHGQALVAALESALQQDGPRADLERGSPVRVLQIDLASGRPIAEFVYRTEPVPHASKSPLRAADNGLVELLAIGDGRLLAVERAFAPGVGVTLRLFETGFDDASDVLGRPSLAGDEALRFMPKRLLLDLADLGVVLDNIEGATLGPRLPNGSQALILVSDNNFRGSQFTQFLAFEVDFGDRRRPDG